MPHRGRIRVAVIQGGRSSEHDISLASARSVIEALDPERYDVRAVEIGRDGRWELGPADERARLESGEKARLPVPSDRSAAPLTGVDVVFPALHGPFGEDGTVQGFLELAGVAYVGAGVTASALCMDKDLFKAVMRDKGVPVVESITVLERHRDRVENPFGFPVVVKPARLGSSVGISIVKAPEELSRAVDLALEHDEKILLEEFVDGIEVECSVLGNEEPIASIPGEIVPLVSDWYDFSAKYDEGGMELVVPPRLDERTIARVQELAVAAFVASDCEGMARVDFFVRKDGEVVVNELNTIPGFTATSVYAKLFEASGIPYAELLDRLVELALERRDRRARLLY
ncbi:MAG TPA: D-alanine--D-alanine ligase family protein [Gaiellaceae bacterium]|nr:D-alanine--D-alanine ligase family protein [Gaiellaceae bacterium]